MSTSQYGESAFFFNPSYSPSWDECYAVQTEEETSPNSQSPRIPDNLCAALRGGESKVSAPSSPLRSSSQTRVSSASASRSSISSDRSVVLIPRSGRRWRSPSPAVRENRSRGGRSTWDSNSRRVRSRTSARFMSNHKPRKHVRRERCIGPAASGQHLPAAIPPSHWYQAIGRRLCVDCKIRGWVQNTSWMCVNCQAPLCLVPYRNCFSRWHMQRS